MAVSGSWLVVKGGRDGYGWSRASHEEHVRGACLFGRAERALPGGEAQEAQGVGSMERVPGEGASKAEGERPELVGQIVHLGARLITAVKAGLLANTSLEA